MLDEDRCDRFDHEAGHHQLGADTIGLPQAWLLVAGRASLKAQAEAGVTRPNLVNVYLDVKDGFETLANEAANEGFTLDCPVTVDRLSATFQVRQYEPVVVESFHRIRKLFPNPLQHAPKKSIEQLDLAV